MCEYKSYKYKSLVYIPDYIYTDNDKMNLLLMRISQIVDGSGKFQILTDTDNTFIYRLGRYDNWELVPHFKNDPTKMKFTFSFRYARSQEWMDKVCEVVCFLADLERFQVRDDLYSNGGRHE